MFAVLAFHAVAVIFLNFSQRGERNKKVIAIGVKELFHFRQP